MRGPRMGPDMDMTHFDPTAYELGGDQSITDPRVRRLDAWANHGRYRVRAPFMTQVTGDLWHGGVEPGLILPDFIDYKLSLFRWCDYEVRNPLRESLTVEMYDSTDQDFDQVTELAEWVSNRRKRDTVFVHLLFDRAWSSV